MTVIGVTGHQVLPAVAVGTLQAGLRLELERCPAPILGLSCLAAGADQLFAEEVLAIGGRLHAVIPAADYSSTLQGSDLTAYRRLLSAADETTNLDFLESGEPAYLAAGEWIVEHCDLLLALWDSEPARGHGGTADIVAHARELGVAVHIIWPEGVRR